MIRVRSNIRSLFFNAPAVLSAMDQKTRAVLGTFGSYVRQTAMRSMRSRKKASEPGMPPSAHPPHDFLRKFIFFAYDPSRKSVVIGPEPLMGKVGASGAPAILEHGGTPGHTKNQRRRVRKLGDAGEVRIVDKATLKKYRKQKINRPWLKKNKDGKWVAYARLKTMGEVVKANEINEALYGPDFIAGKPIAARPYMGPALEKEMQGLPNLWKGSIKTAT